MRRRLWVAFFVFHVRIALNYGYPTRSNCWSSNVGKSSIFNWLAGRRLAIVDDVAGVTRDRLITLIEYRNTHFELIDTGGMGIEDVDNLTKEVEQQIEAGIDEADVLVFVVDNRSGIAPLDEEVAQRLRKVDKPIILVANKCDHPNQDDNANEFLQLGRGWLCRVSTLQNRNRDELLDLIHQRLPHLDTTPDEVKPADMKIAIVGRRNTGKSTFVNTLAKAQRMIVSEVPGQLAIASMSILNSTAKNSSPSIPQDCGAIVRFEPTSTGMECIVHNEASGGPMWYCFSLTARND